MSKRKREKHREFEEADDKIAVYVDTSIDTHLIVYVSSLISFSLLKQEIVSEHKNCFPMYEEIKIDAIKVKQDNIHYYVPESMPIRTAFCGALTPFVMVDVAGTPNYGLPSDQPFNGQNFHSNTAGWKIMSQQHYHEPEAMPIRPPFYEARAPCVMDDFAGIHSHGVPTPQPDDWCFQSNLANSQYLSKQQVPKDLFGNCKNLREDNNRGAKTCVDAEPNRISEPSSPVKKHACQSKNGRISKKKTVVTKNVNLQKNGSATLDAGPFKVSETSLVCEMVEKKEKNADCPALDVRGNSAVASDIVSAGELGETTGLMPELEGNNMESDRALNQEREKTGRASGSDVQKNKKKKKKMKRKLNVDKFSTMHTVSLDHVPDIINGVVASINSENPTYKGESDKVTTGADRVPEKLIDDPMLQLPRNEVHNSGETLKDGEIKVASVTLSDMKGRIPNHENGADSAGAPCGSQVKTAKKKKNDVGANLDNAATNSDNVVTGEDISQLQLTDSHMLHLTQNKPPNSVEDVMESGEDAALLKAPDMMGRTLSHANSVENSGGTSQSRVKKDKKTKRDDASVKMQDLACKRRSDNVTATEDGEALQISDSPMHQLSHNEPYNILEEVKESERDVASLKAPGMRGRTLSNENGVHNAGVLSESWKKKGKKTKKDDVTGVTSSHAANFDLMPDMASIVVAGMKETTHSEKTEKKKEPAKAKRSIKETKLPNTRQIYDTPNKNMVFSTRYMTRSQNRGYIPIKGSSHIPSGNVSTDSGEESELSSKVRQIKVDTQPLNEVAMMAQAGEELLQPSPISTTSDNVEARTMEPKQRAPNKQFISKMDSPEIIAEKHVCGEETGMAVQETVDDVHPSTYKSVSGVENQRENAIDETSLQKLSAEVEELRNLDKDQRQKSKKKKLVFPSSVDTPNGYSPETALASVDVASRQEDLTVSDNNRQRESTGESLPNGSKKKRKKKIDSLASVGAASKLENRTRRDSLLSVEALSKQELPVSEKSLRTEKSSLDISLLLRSDDRAPNDQMVVSLPVEEVPSLVSGKSRRTENTSSSASLQLGSKKKRKKDHDSLSSLNTASKQEDLTVSSKSGKREKPSSDANLPLANNLKAKNRDSLISFEAVSKEDLPLSEKSGRSEKYSPDTNPPQDSKQKRIKDLDSLSSVRSADAAPKQEHLTVSSKKGQSEKPSSDANLPRSSKGKVKNRDSLSSVDASSKPEDLTLSNKSVQKGTISDDVSLPLKVAPEREFSVLTKPDAKHRTISKEVVDIELFSADPGKGFSDVPSREVSSDLGKGNKLTSKASQAKAGSPLDNVEARAVEPKKRSKNKQFTSKMDTPELLMQERVGEEQTGMAVQKTVAVGKNGVENQKDSQHDGLDETSSQQVSAKVDVRNLDKSQISEMKKKNKKKKLDGPSSVDTSSKAVNDSTVHPKVFPERDQNRLLKPVLKHSTVSKEVDTEVLSSDLANTVARVNDKIKTVLKRGVPCASTNDGRKSSETSDASSGSSGELTHHGKNAKQVQNKDDLNRIDFRTPSQKNPGVVNTSSQKKGWSSGGVLLGDLSSESSDDEEDLAYGSSSSTRTPSNTQYSSDYSSGGETHGDTVTSQPASSQGGKKEKTISNASDGKKEVNLESLMKSSRTFKKAKRFADSQPQDGESEPPEFVPDSQA